MKIIWGGKKLGINLYMKNMGDYHEPCLKKDV